MPKRKGYSKKKRVKKKYGNSGTVVSLGVSPFPASMITKHRYCQRISLSPDANDTDFYLFNANSMFNPGQSGGSLAHQPLGFDEYSALYDHSTVLSSKITIDALAGGDLSTDACMVGCYINDDLTPVVTYSTIMEQGGCVSKILSPLDAQGVVTLRKSFDTKRYFGVKDVQDNEKLQASSDGNATELAFFTVFAQGASSAQPASILLNVMIEYTALWTERRSIDQS